MASKKKNEVVGLVCKVCKSQNYVTTRNKTNLEGAKLVLQKYCKHCRKKTEHKETAKLK